MVAIGLTVKLVPVKLPGINVYVLAPDGVIIELPPEQIELELIEPAVIVGVGLTVIVVVKFPANELTHPVALVPLIV